MSLPPGPTRSTDMPGTQPHPAVETFHDALKARQKARLDRLHAARKAHEETMTERFQAAVRAQEPKPPETPSE